MQVIRLNKKIFSRLLITRWTRRKYILIFFVIFLCFLSSFYTIILVRSSTILSTHKSNLSYVVVHLDFKRTPLKLDYLKRLLYELKNHGATALLLEYEDMFPYEGELISLRSKHYYTKKELKQFLEHSNALGLEIIPLIQTFGHLEFVLKHNKFRHLRENFAYIDSLCPSKKESRRLIKNLLFQVIEFHKSITPLKHFHVGCDEVYNMNSCKNCVERNLTKLEIYLDHIQTVTNMVKDFSPGTTVLIWDDMLRTVSLTNWNINTNIPVELVYWNYEKSFQVSHVNLMKYHKTFPNIWIATAYKGADGIESVLPNVEKRFLNHFTWLQEIYDYTFGGEKEVFNFKGIILTGWSRYFHLAPSCDLLPASIPSLILNLLLVKDFITGDFTSAVKTKWFFKLNDPSGYFHEYLNHKLEKSLQCESVEVSFSNFNNKLVDFDNLLLSNCNFEEWKFYEHLKQYLELNSNVVTSHKVSKYIQRNKVINGENESSWCKDVSNQVIEINASLTNTMNKYYETDFIVEYVSDKISYLTKTIVKSCGILYNT
ncbi:hexosaminidase D-like [Amyelois transitella]|uniref:hexosaminidase D-like n=1 Tax=Amyelois transitella TaxID=680683 RepID=UPI00298F95E2|nr:hexosaminidase D-like [Amyelois transitella]